MKCALEYLFIQLKNRFDILIKKYFSHEMCVLDACVCVCVCMCVEAHIAFRMVAHYGEIVIMKFIQQQLLGRLSYLLKMRLIYGPCICLNCFVTVMIVIVYHWNSASIFSAKCEWPHRIYIPNVQCPMSRANNVQCPLAIYLNWFIRNGNGNGEWERGLGCWYISRYDYRKYSVCYLNFVRIESLIPACTINP